MVIVHLYAFKNVFNNNTTENAICICLCNHANVLLRPEMARNALAAEASRAPHIVSVGYTIKAVHVSHLFTCCSEKLSRTLKAIECSRAELGCR